MNHEDQSLVKYIEKQIYNQQQKPFKDQIEANDFNYFNYGLTTATWNLLVNK
jgi:hypothetical protein